MTSPAAMPALAAGVFGATWVISAPLPTPLPVTPTPRKPVRPMWTVALPLPDSIWLAMETALLIGMAKLEVAELDDPNPERRLLEEAAVSIPMTWPFVLTKGPPESPGWIGALVSIMPFRVSALEPSSSLAVMLWLSACTVPVTTDGGPPTPPALPS